MDKFGNKIKDLFDKVSNLSFGEIMTLKALKFMYWIEIGLGGVLAAITVVLGFKESVVLGIIAATISPVLLFVYVVIVKVIFEVLSAVFRFSSLMSKLSNLSPDDFIEEDKRVKIDEDEIEEVDEDDNK